MPHTVEGRITVQFVFPGAMVFYINHEKSLSKFPKHDKGQSHYGVGIAKCIIDCICILYYCFHFLLLSVLLTASAFSLCHFLILI